MGGIMDGIAQALTSSLHFENGLPLEGSWDNYFYTRQWNVPPDVEIVVMPPTTGEPGGAGEFGVGSVDGRGGLRLRPGHRDHADQLSRSTTTAPSGSPRHRSSRRDPLPESPTDGLSNTF